MQKHGRIREQLTAHQPFERPIDRPRFWGCAFRSRFLLTYVKIWDSELLPPDPEIEKTYRRLLRKKKDRETTMANNEDKKVLRDYAVLSLTSTTSCIWKPTIQSNNFELKMAVIQLVQSTYKFGGLPNNDPKKHASFLEICDTQKYNGISIEAVRLMLFPFSLKDKAKNWFYSLPRESISSWDEMASKFLAKYFSPSKSA